MILVSARQQGGAVVMTIPSDLVKLLNLKAGDQLKLEVVPGGFVARVPEPVTRKRYSLSELLEGVDENTMKALLEETAWAREGGPVGRELA